MWGSIVGARSLARGHRRSRIKERYWGSCGIVWGTPDKARHRGEIPGEGVALSPAHRYARRIKSDAQIVTEAKPPSIAMFWPVTKDDALRLANQIATPDSSSGLPNRAIGVWPMI